MCLISINVRKADPLYTDYRSGPENLLVQRSVEAVEVLL